LTNDSKDLVNAKFESFCKGNTSATRIYLTTSFESLKSSNLEIDTTVKDSGKYLDIQIRSDVNEKELYSAMFGYQVFSLMLYIFFGLNDIYIVG